MAGNNFFKKIKATINVQERFETQADGASEPEKRVLEQALLQPIKVQKYEGPEPKYKSALDALCVTVVFSSKAEMDLVARHMTISENVRHEQYITNIDFLLNLIKQYELGSIGPDLGASYPEPPRGLVEGLTEHVTNAIQEFLANTYKSTPESKELEEQAPSKRRKI